MERRLSMWFKFDGNHRRSTMVNSDGQRQTTIVDVGEILKKKNSGFERRRNGKREEREKKQKIY